MSKRDLVKRDSVAADNLKLRGCQAMHRWFDLAGFFSRALKLSRRGLKLNAHCEPFWPVQSPGLALIVFGLLRKIFLVVTAIVANELGNAVNLQARVVWNVCAA